MVSISSIGSLPSSTTIAVINLLIQAIGALLSAFLTFVVLTGLTPIEPTREVVYSFLLINAACILLLVGIIIREVWQNM